MFWIDEYCDEATCFALEELGYPWFKIKVQGGSSAPIYYTLPKDHPDWADCDAYYAFTIYEAMSWLRREKNIDIMVKPYDATSVFMGGEKYYWMVYHEQRRISSLDVSGTVKYEEAAKLAINIAIKYLREK